MNSVVKSFVSILLSMFAIAPVVSAGDFSESFKNWVLGPQASAAVVKLESVSLDAVSAECIQCHNGRNSSHIAIKSADSPMQFSPSGRQSNHPVGMNYDKYVVSQPASFRSRSALNPNINFANGQVACISCHEQKDREEIVNGHGSYTGLTLVSSAPASKKDMCTSKKTLTVGPKKTDLCMSCHAM